MPIYDQRCDNELCNFEFEVMQRREQGNPLCPTCGASTTRLISPCGWSLDGEGWYNPHNPLRSHRGGVGGKK